MLDICNEMEDSDDGSNNHEVHGAEAKDRSPVHVNAHVAEPRLVDHAESTTPDQRKGASDTESISSNNNRKRKQMASNIDMRSAGNYSLVGLSAQNLLKDGFRTSFRMSDFAVPNSRGKPPKK